MFSRRAVGGDPSVHIDRTIALRLSGTGLVVGLLSGFLGIGGGFLIVPAIMLGSGMATINAVGSSPVSPMSALRQKRTSTGYSIVTSSTRRRRFFRPTYRRKPGRRQPRVR
jgi:hypothetical protein